MHVPSGVGAVLIIVVLGGWSWPRANAPAWSSGEKDMIASLSLAALPALPADRSNAVAVDESAA